jgi:hypothetical protein
VSGAGPARRGAPGESGGCSHATTRAGIPLLAWILVLSGCFDQPPEQGDRDLVLGIEQLEPHGLTLPADFAAYEKLSRERWIDGSVMIEYEFDAPKELENSPSSTRWRSGTRRDRTPACRSQPAT